MNRWRILLWKFISRLIHKHHVQFPSFNVTDVSLSRYNKRLAITSPAPCVYYVFGVLFQHSFTFQNFPPTSSSTLSGKHNEQRESFKWIFHRFSDCFMFPCNDRVASRVVEITQSATYLATNRYSKYNFPKFDVSLNGNWGSKTKRAKLEMIESEAQWKSVFLIAKLFLC